MDPNIGNFGEFALIGWIHSARYLNENKNNTIIVSLITIILISVAFMHKGMNMRG